MSKVYRIYKENRVENQEVDNDRRKDKSILRDDLVYAIDTQKWKIEQLYKLIDNKEKRNF